MAKERDWIFGGLLACCSLLIAAALLLFIQTLLQSSMPLGNLRIADFPNISYLSPISPLQGWDPVLLGLFFLFLAFLLYYAARRRALENNKLQAGSGCPSCDHSKLVRVSRTRRDRFLAYSLIPMGRFVCPYCSWEGRRIVRRLKYARKSGVPTKPSQLKMSNDSSEKEPLKKSGKSAQDLLKEEWFQNSTGALGDLGAESQETATQAKNAAESVPADQFSTVIGYQLKVSPDQVIKVFAQDDTGAAEQGEVVGTLHIKLWKVAGSDANFMAWLDHNTTEVTTEEGLSN